jgi:hypothetical protein
VTGLVDAIERELGPVDVLALNATGPQPEAPLAAWVGATISISSTSL